VSERRIKVEFLAQTDSSVLPAVVTMFEPYATIYQNHEARSLVILPKPAHADHIREQLAIWEKEGALTWTYTAT
jgi:hypothetical protein